MPKYLILKHYRGTPATVNDVPMDRWTPDEVDAHMQFMADFGQRLEEQGELVDAQALSPEGAFVRADDRGAGAITDGPFAETKDLIAGWMIIDVESWDRALELLMEASALLHENNRAPRTPGTLHVSQTSWAFEMTRPEGPA